MESRLKTFIRMFNYATPYLPIFVLSLILTILVVTLDGLSLWFSGSLLHTIFASDFTAVTKPVFSLGTINAMLKYYTWKMLTIYGETSRKNILLVICLLIPLLFLTKNILFYFQQLLVSKFNLSIIRDMRNQFYRHLLNLPVNFFDKNQSGHVISLIVRDQTEVSSTLSATMNKSIIEPLRFLFFWGLLAIINIKLTAIVLIIYPIIGHFLVKTGASIRRRSTRMLHSFSGMVAILTETIRGIRAVKMFNSAHYEQNKFKNENDLYIHNSYKEQCVRHAIGPFTEVVAMSVFALLLWVGGKEVLSNTKTFASDDFIRFLLILYSSYMPLKRMTSINAELQRGFSAADRVFAVHDTATEPVDDSSDKPPVVFNNIIEYRNVSFNYTGYKEQVLKDINFTINRGETVALVGASGSGKSTILDLLPRFYDACRGAILIDNVDIKTFSLHNLRELFGIVSQETILFNDTVLRNVAYGTQEPDIQRAKAAIEAAYADEFVLKLPDGIQTVIGEQGITLSGGQRQRLAIARALYKDPQVLIFDEATSSLDTESEQLVQQAIDNLIKDRTTFVVAHRLSTIRHAHTILVLENGAIVEKGTHDELFQLNNRYKYFHDIQFSFNAQKNTKKES